MRCLSPDYGAIVFPRIETEIPRYHKEERNGETADRLYGNSDHSREFTMHEDNAKAGKSLYEIQTTVILSHNCSPTFLTKK